MSIDGIIVITCVYSVKYDGNGSLFVRLILSEL